MPHHEWGDDWDVKHGDKLEQTCSYCCHVWKKWGRIGTHGKTKYGTFRDHIYMWDGGLHTLIWPGYVRLMNKFLYCKIDRWIVRPLTQYTGLYKLGLMYQAMVYNYAVQKMCKKYPEIIDEIVSDLDGYEMVKPGIFGNIDGEKIHKKYWKTI